jgi:glycosyltransferase involved in cell wall biosynthesis
VAYLGLLTDYQGVPHMLEAAVRFKQNNREAHFLIMGYPNVNKYQQLAEQMGVADSVTFTGKVPYQEAPYFLSLGDVAIAPKQSNTEGSGKLLNYMAMAQPIVAYDSAVHQEYLADLGVYAPMGDVVAFSDAVATLLDDPCRRVHLGGKLRRRAIENYSWHKTAVQIERLYQRLTTDFSVI